MTCLTNQTGPALGPAHRAQLLSSSLLETLFILRHLSSDGRAAVPCNHNAIRLFSHFLLSAHVYLPVPFSGLPAPLPLSPLRSPPRPPLLNTF